MKNPEPSQPNPVFKTCDLTLAAFLRAKGMLLGGIERQGRRAFFIFPDNEQLQGLVLAFHNGGEVGALRFAASRRELLSFVKGGDFLGGEEQP